MRLINNGRCNYGLPPTMTMMTVLLVNMMMLLSLLFPSSSLLAVVMAEPVQLYGLNYNTRKGPDWDPDKCKTYSEVVTDLTMLKRITNRIRILSLTDCGQGELVWSVAQQLGMQLWLGLWVAPSPDEDFVFEDELTELARLFSVMDMSDGDSPTILGITVGSEVIYREDATEEQMIDNMNAVYTIVQNVGLDDQIPVSICDVYPVYERSPTLRSVVNVSYINDFPFWNGTSIDRAADQLDTELSLILSYPESSNKRLILGETGWPASGYIEGVGVAGPDNQKQYFIDSYCLLQVEKQWEYYWFTGISNEWRQEQDPNNTIEGTFGFLYANRTLRDHFVDLSFTCSDGITYTFTEIDWSIPEGFTDPPVVLDSASCAAHDGCASLAGNCCPNDDGLVLGCCGEIVDNSPEEAPTEPLFNETESPTTAPTNDVSGLLSNETESPTTSPSPTMTPTTSSSSSSDTIVPTSGGTSDGTTIEPTPSPTPSDGDDNDETTESPTPMIVESDAPSMAPTTTNVTDDGGPTAEPTPTQQQQQQPNGPSPTRPPFSFEDSAANSDGSAAATAITMTTMSLVVSTMMVPIIILAFHL